MTADEITKGRWYPMMPPALPGETDEAYTDRLTGADGTSRRPYDHRRNRQCSIGWHNECSDPEGHTCKCPCHEGRVHADRLVAEWNRDVPVGTVVSFIEGTTPAEPPATTTSRAYRGSDTDHPVVDLDTFPHPVLLAWLVKPEAPVCGIKEAVEAKLRAGQPITARWIVTGSDAPVTAGISVWRAGDPEPGPHVREVRAVGAHGWRARWRRVTPPGSPEYRWFNGDKYKRWEWIAEQWGPLVDVAALRRMHAAYGRRRRARKGRR